MSMFCFLIVVFLFFFFKQKTAYEMLRSLVGSEMCIRDRMWLVPKSNQQLSSAETARYIYEAIQNHSAISVPFGWLGTVGNYVNVLLEYSGISTGDYYLAWKAITDNTSPMIRAVKVVDVTI